VSGFVFLKQSPERADARLFASACLPLLKHNVAFTESSADAGKEVRPEADVEKAKHMLLSRHQSAGLNDDVKIV
jgi:hypothetical protein